MMTVIVVTVIVITVIVMTVIKSRFAVVHIGQRPDTLALKDPM